MITADNWRNAPHKRVVLFGMSGLGKTHISNILRASGAWFHYSVDYRIGTRYMGEDIVDNFKRHAMENPFLAELLRSDSIFIGSNITFENLAPLSTYLGKPGNPELGGLPCDEYIRRQELHRNAEIAALMDTGHFARRGADIYGYDNFVCDTGGSICEVVDPENPNDPVLRHLSDTALMVWIKGSDDHTAELIHRFDAAPKPMYYQPAFLERVWNDYLSDNDCAPEQVDPDDFVRTAYAQSLVARQPRYQSMADNWGISIDAADMARVKSVSDFNDVIAAALEMRA